MRKHFNLLTGMLCLFTLICVGCSNSFSGTMSGENPANSLTITIDNYDEVITEEPSSSINANSRTIVAEQYTTASSLFYYLYGNAEDGSTLGVKEVNIQKDSNNNKKGIVILENIESRNWFLTLAVTKTTGLTSESDVKSDAVLIGYANVDMQYGREATFTLTSDGLTKSGNVNLDLYTNGWQTSAFSSKAAFNALYQTSVAIYNIKDGSIEKDATTSKLTTLYTFAGTDADSLSDDDTTPSEYNKEMLPGTYLFQVTFTSKKDTSVKFAWHDVLIVIPGTTIDKKIPIPNIIGTPPAAPTDFKVTYQTADIESWSADRYAAHFQWTSAADNERWFTIELAEIDNANTAAITTPTDDDTWNAAIAADTTGSTYKAAKVTRYDAGTYMNDSDVYIPNKTGKNSLLAGNTEVFMNLELGKRYVARICATNDTADSAWTYYTLPATADSEIGFTSTTINLFRIKYDLQKGLYFKEGSTTTLANATKNPVTKYYSQKDDNPILISGAWGTTAPATTDPTIAKNNGTETTQTWIPWATWKDGKGTQYKDIAGVTYTAPVAAADPNPAVPESAVYAGSKNLELFAVYGSEPGAFEIIDPATYKINSKWIMINSKELGNVDATNDMATHSATTNKPNGTTISLTLPTGTDTWTYDKVWISIETKGLTTAKLEEVGAARGSSNSLTANLSAGTYNVSITAKKGSVYNHFTISLSITNN